MDKYEALNFLRGLQDPGKYTPLCCEAVAIAIEVLSRDLGVPTDKELLTMFRVLPDSGYITDRDILPVLRKIFMMGVESVRNREKSPPRASG